MKKVAHPGKCGKLEIGRERDKGGEHSDQDDESPVAKVFLGGYGVYALREKPWSSLGLPQPSCGRICELLYRYPDTDIEFSWRGQKGGC